MSSWDTKQQLKTQEGKLVELLGKCALDFQTIQSYFHITLIYIYMFHFP
jgi:hypothetical protein